MMFSSWRIMDKLLRKTNTLRDTWFGMLVFLGLDISPFLQLFLFPEKFFTLPMRGTIAPEVEINIKARSNESPEIVHMEPNSLARH